MTINSDVNKIQIATGATIVITGLSITDSSQLVITLLTAAVAPATEDTESTLVLNSDYTVNDALNTATLTTAIDGTILKRATATVAIPETQTTDYVNVAEFNSETAEAALDKMTLKLKEIEEILDRVIAAPISTPSSSFDLPVLEGQAGKYLKLNATEDGFDLEDITSITFWEAYTFPTADGTSEQILKTDGANTLSFTTPATPATFTGLTVEALLIYDQGTPTITKSTNVTSVTDTGTGNFTVNFTTVISDGDYLVMGTARGDGSNVGVLSSNAGDTKTTSALQCRVSTTASLSIDSPEVSLLILTET